MISKYKKMVLRFNNTFPKTYASKLFSNRNEISLVLKGGVDKLLTEKILETFPSCSTKDELIVTTYFEPVLVFDPRKTCVIRFRQRVDQKAQMKNFIPPEKWLLRGPGNLEVKIRAKNREKVSKLGTILPAKKGQDIYELMRLTKAAETKARRDLIDFITRANTEQIKATKESERSYLCLISPKILLRIADFLTPQFTRVNLRTTFELSQPQEARVTVESHPAYYAYPIYHRVHEKSPFRAKYYGFLAECPDRTKIEIKTVNRDFGKKIEKKLFPIFRKHKVPKDKLTEMPFSQMAVKVSKQQGSLVDECPDREIEMKAGIIKKVNVASLIQKVREKLLKIQNSPYRLFPTDPEVSVRGEAELNRTIIGWQDDAGKWHEVVTIIRLTKEGAEEFGFCAILKWKTDPQEKLNEALNRGQKHDYLNAGMTDRQLLKKASRLVGRKLQIVGVIKKMKFRVYVQDDNGRNFCVSLDECTSPNFPQILQQLEVEYIHTVIANVQRKPDTTVDESCMKCMDYVIQLLNRLGVLVEKTHLRKIDFVGSARRP